MVLRENFDIMNLDITIYNSDIFSDLSDPPRFDIVLSMPIRMLHTSPISVSMDWRGGKRHRKTGAEVSTRFPASFSE